MATTTTTTTQTLKLSTNPLETEKTHLIEALSRKIEAQAGSYGDWRDDLLRDGYVVVKGAFSRENALDYRERMFEWLKHVSPSVDRNDKETWENDKMPDHQGRNIFTKHGVTHEKFFWDLRAEPGIKGAFAKLWGTDELLVSFDAINISFPGVKKGIRNLQTSDGWPHVDQSPFRNGLCCVQGIAQLSDSGPKDGSLVVIKRSNMLVERFFREVLPKERWTAADFATLTKDELQWFFDNGAEQIKVEAEPGDLILWDSRTVHWGQQPQPDAPNIRTIAYLCYTPAEWAQEDQLEKKRAAFEKYQSTTHWPHDNINTRTQPALLANGEIDPTDTGMPRELPECTDEMLKMAGIKPY